MKSKFGFTTKPQPPQPSSREIEQTKKKNKLVTAGKKIDSLVMDVLIDLANAKGEGSSPTSYLDAFWEDTSWHGARWFIDSIDYSYSRNNYRNDQREVDIWLDYQNDDKIVFIVEILRGNEDQEELSLSTDDILALFNALGKINNYPVKLGKFTAKYVRKYKTNELLPFL